MISRPERILVASIALLVMASAAHADLLLATDLNPAATNTIHVSLGTSAGGTNVINNEYVYAGPFNVTWTETLAGGGSRVMGPILTFCVKLTANIDLKDSYGVTLGNTNSLINGAPALNGNGALIAAIARDTAIPTTALGGEARQLAFWSALSNGAGPLNGANDLFSVNKTDLNASANAGLEQMTDALLTRAAAAANSSQTAPVFYATGRGQDMVELVSPTVQVQSVPEPSTILLAGFGLAGRAGRRPLAPDREDRVNSGLGGRFGLFGF